MSTVTPQLVNDRPRPAEGFSHIGDRYLLGYGADFYAIYDKLERRSTPTEPVAVFPRTADGWLSAWQLFSSWEPNSHPVSLKRSPKENGATGSQVSNPIGEAPKVVGFAERLSPQVNMTQVRPIEIRLKTNNTDNLGTKLHRLRRRLHLLKAKSHPIKRAKKILRKSVLKLRKKKI